MKKISIFMLVVILFFSPKLYWTFIKKPQQLDVLIIDKTVPTDSFREHLGLFWILTNEKVTHFDDQLYDITNDYYGFNPYIQQPFPNYEATHKVDLIYVADTYGVYTDDIQLHVEGDRSQKIYGGMDELEWEEIMASKGEHTLLIAEYNSFATPTEEKTRAIMEKDLHIKWSGWIGRYFESLTSAEVPPWLMTNYEQQYEKTWSFTTGGMAFVNIDDEVIIIEEKDMKAAVQFQLTKEGNEQFPYTNHADYAYWFDIVQPTDEAIVLAQYQLTVKKSAQEILQQAGIPLQFPAIVHHPQKNTYYFAGDYADYTKSNLMKWYRSDLLMRVFSNDLTNFFWDSYVPTMRTLIQNIEPQ